MSLKDFKGCDVQYAYGKDSQVYSMKVNFKGKPMILTVRVGKDIMDMTLTDMNGKVMEYIGQKGDKVEFTKAKK